MAGAGMLHSFSRGVPVSSSERGVLKHNPFQPNLTHINVRLRSHKTRLRPVASSPTQQQHWEQARLFLAQSVPDTHCRTKPGVAEV